MSLHDRCPLNASSRRARKRTLAARDGAWCAYCWRLFADLRHATIDHIAPLSLFHTWRVEHTVLACKPCNDRKANRLPLLIALLLTAAPDSGVHGGTGRAFTRADWVLLARLAGAHKSAVSALESPDSGADRLTERSRGDQREQHLVRTLYAVPVGPVNAAHDPTAHPVQQHRPARLVCAPADPDPAGSVRVREAA